MFLITFLSLAPAWKIYITLWRITLVKKGRSLQKGDLTVGFPIWSDEWCAMCIINCSTLDQTYWFLTVGTGIFGALCFCGKMITFSSSHGYFIITPLPSIQILPTLFLKSNYATDMSIIFPLWNCPRARAPFNNRDVIFMDGSLISPHLFTWSCSWVLWGDR